MELIVAILLALGSLTSPEEFTPDWEAENPAAMQEAQQVIDNDAYRYDEESEDGGVVVDHVNV